ncbi:MAG: hypothetical protein JW910_13935 [Anaerolineae bacterium]|nr:hypothetical protein [Anaerolineae bacterium]
MPFDHKPYLPLIVLVSALGVLLLLIGALGGPAGEATPAPGATVYLCAALPDLRVPGAAYGAATIYQGCDDLSADLSFANITLAPGAVLRPEAALLAENAAGTRAAFLDHAVDADLLLLDRATDRVVAVQGVPLPNRPLTNVVWLDADRLAFDRWSQPHFGYRYVIDAASGVVVQITVLADAVYLQDQFTPGALAAFPRIPHDALPAG